MYLFFHFSVELFMEAHFFIRKKTVENLKPLGNGIRKKNQSKNQCVYSTACTHILLFVCEKKTIWPKKLWKKNLIFATGEQPSSRSKLIRIIQCQDYFFCSVFTTLFHALQCFGLFFCSVRLNVFLRFLCEFRSCFFFRSTLKKIYIELQHCPTQVILIGQVFF